MSNSLTELTVVCGAGDDLIEVEGPVNAEFSALNSDDGTGSVVAFSDGTALRVRYTPQGVWRIAVVAVGGGSNVSVESCPEDDDDNYTDQATIRSVVGAIRWAVNATSIVIWPG